MSRRKAYEKVVDRLLASPRYAERMAIRWLEAARYADTNGYQTDGPRTMWRWRDWVIDAFHRDMPYDQFTIEQIAGDLLPECDARRRRSRPASTAITATSAEGGIVDEEFRVEYVADRAETTGTVWLGLTVGLRALPRPQVRSDHAEGLLLALRVLQQRARAGLRVELRQ